MGRSICLKIRDRYLRQTVFCFDVAAYEIYLHGMSCWRDEYAVNVLGTVVAREMQTCHLSE